MLFKLAVARMSNPFKISCIMWHLIPFRSRLGLILSVICTIQHLGIFRYYCRIIILFFFLSDQTFLLPSKGINQSRREVLHMLSFRWQIINWDYQNYQIGKNGRMNFIAWLIWGKWEDIKLLIASSRESYDIHVHVYLIFS